MDQWYNGSGKPLSSGDWLLHHHQAKIDERTAFANRLIKYNPNIIVDLGCGTGLWLDLLNKIAPTECEFIGIDMDETVLSEAKILSKTWARKSSFHSYNFEEIDLLPNADVFMMFNIFPYIKTPNIFIESLRKKLNPDGILAIRQYDGAALRFGPIDHKKRLIIDNALYSSVGTSEQFRHYDMDRIFELIDMSSFVKKNIDFELYKRVSPFDQDFINYYKNTIEWTMRYISENAKKILDDWYQQYVLNHEKNGAYFFEVDLTAVLHD
ncbi:MAG: methyltransferase domain-containing protein [Sulfuricurvum sp.]|nr:methyltransferase domain-containing protein [Sulfuricurvum sp.]